MGIRYIIGLLLLFTIPELRAQLDSRGVVTGASPKASGAGLQQLSELPDNKPIVKPLKEGMKLCAPGCDSIRNWGITGDAAHKARPSCHNSDEAIDIAAVGCPNGEMSPTQNKDKFEEFVTCMGTKAKKQYEKERYYGKWWSPLLQLKDAVLGDGFKVLYDGIPQFESKGKGHSGHVHIQLKQCRPKRG